MEVAILLVTERAQGNAREVVAQFVAPPECHVRSKYFDYLEIIKIARTTSATPAEKRQAILNFFLEQGFTHQDSSLVRSSESCTETEYVIGLPQSTD